MKMINPRFLPQRPISDAQKKAKDPDAYIAKKKAGFRKWCSHRELTDDESIVVDYILENLGGFADPMLLDAAAIFVGCYDEHRTEDTV